MLVSVFRCNVVINFFENAYKVSVTEDSCDECGSNLLQVDFSKVLFLDPPPFITLLLGSKEKQEQCFQRKHVSPHYRCNLEIKVKVTKI